MKFTPYLVTQLKTSLWCDQLSTTELKLVLRQKRQVSMRAQVRGNGMGKWEG